MGLQERQRIRDLTEKTLPEREKEITEICGGTARYEVDWDSLANDAEALRFLDNLSCHRLNMALRSISMDPMGKDALRDGLKTVKLRNVKTEGNCTGRHPARGGQRREERDWVWRCRPRERYSVLTAGTKGLPRNTRRNASRALSPFLRAVET